MKKFITVKGVSFELFFEESGTLVSLESDYCEEGMLQFIIKNLPNGLSKFPDIEKNISLLMEEYNRNNIK